MVERGTLEEALKFAQQFSGQEPTPGALPSIGEEFEPLPTPSNSHLEKLTRENDKAADTHYLTQDDISFVLDLAEKKRLEAELWDKTAKAIGKEAPAAFALNDELIELGNQMVGGKKLADIVTEIYGTEVEVNGHPAQAVYLHGEDKQIKYSHEKSKPIEDLTSFARFGVFPFKTRTDQHEKIHAAQFNLGSPTIPPELLEAQAYRAARLPDWSHIPHEKLVNSMFTSPNMADLYKHLDQRKFSSALYSIDRFNALGLSQLQIIKTISNPGPWDEESGFWPNIQDSLQREMKSRGVDSKSLENLVAANILEQSIARHKARIVTQRVLRDAFSTDLGKRMRQGQRPIPASTRILAKTR